MIALLEERVDVFSVEPNYVVSIDSVANDTYVYSYKQWAINKIDLADAWGVATGSSTVIVGIIDTGIDGDHPDLSHRVNVELSECFGEDFIDPLDDIHGHGTHVAGIIGAEGNNATGVCRDVQLVSLRAANNDGTFSLDNIVSAINYAEEENIPILNLSIGGPDYSTTQYAAIQNYSGLVVCSAGNNSQNTDQSMQYPSCYDLDNIISVGASTSNDTLWNSSDQGSNFGILTVDIFAPGEYIWSTYADGEYAYMSGTSMAAPHVAGVAALLLSLNPQLTPAEIKARIMIYAETVYDSEGNTVFGTKCVSGKRLNAYMALHSHSFTITMVDFQKHSANCAECGYTYQEWHSWNAIRTKCLVCSYDISGSVPIARVWDEEMCDH